ncbi:hypothetical protein F8507_21070 [Bacillus toyonensis]|nr:hypothetical protein F8507_21070 [Bacillus toyonensis]
MIVNILLLLHLKIFFLLYSRVFRTFTYQEYEVGITIAYIKDERIKRGNSNVTSCIQTKSSLEGYRIMERCY